MPRLFQLLNKTANPSTSLTVPAHSYEGFTEDGRVVLRDRRGTVKAELPDINSKSETLGSDPLAIYKPSGAKSVDAAKAMGNFTGWTFAAVNAIASEVANVQLRLYRVDGEDHTEVDDHELLTLLDAPNDHMTGIELKYVLMSHLELAGNFFAYLEGVRNETDQPRALHPLNPGAVRVKLTKDFPQKLDHYEYTLNGQIYKFQPYEILHIKYVDPNDPFVGIGIPQTIPSWIDSDNYAMEYNRKFFVNGAQVGLFIQTETNVEGNIDRIRKSWRNRQEGVENAHQVPVLPKGVELKHTGVTHKDMDFGNLANETRDRILAAFRVSKTILGTAESDTNRATAETADYVFSKRTIKPKMLLIVSYLNEFLVPRYGDDLYLTFIDPTPEDKAAKMVEMSTAVGAMPVVTQNEARQNYLGLGPVEGGDQLMHPSSMIAAGQTGEPEGDDLAPGNAAAAETPGKMHRAKTAEGWEAKPIRVRTGGKTAHSGAYQARKALLAAFQKQLDKVPGFQTKNFNELTKDEYYEHWKRFADRSERAESELTEIFDHINAKQKEEVLSNLSTATGVTKDLGELFDLKEWIGITINLATPVLTTLAKDEATAALAMIGARNQDILADDATRRALEQGISKMARSYNETTLRQLTEVLNEKLTQTGGTNLTELKEAVDGVYSFADERRAGLIAKTESFRAANWANREAWQKSGMVKSLKFYTAEDDRVCVRCNELDGTEVGIEDKFFEDDYSDGMVPPVHPDCRCYIRPELIS